MENSRCTFWWFQPYYDIIESLWESWNHPQHINRVLGQRLEQCSLVSDKANISKQKIKQLKMEQKRNEALTPTRISPLEVPVAAYDFIVESDPFSIVVLSGL